MRPETAEKGLSAQYSPRVSLMQSGSAFAFGSVRNPQGREKPVFNMLSAKAGNWRRARICATQALGRWLYSRPPA